MVSLKEVKKWKGGTLVNNDDVGVRQDTTLYHVVVTSRTKTFVTVETKILKLVVDGNNLTSNHPMTVNTEKRTPLKVGRIVVGDGLVVRLIDEENVDLLKRIRRIYVNHKSLTD